jgi:hypothetical protein
MGCKGGRCSNSSSIVCSEMGCTWSWITATVETS